MRSTCGIDLAFFGDSDVAARLAGKDLDEALFCFGSDLTAALRFLGVGVRAGGVYSRSSTSSRIESSRFTSFFARFERRGVSSGSPAASKSVTWELKALTREVSLVGLRADAVRFVADMPVIARFAIRRQAVAGNVESRKFVADRGRFRSSVVIRVADVVVRE